MTSPAREPTCSYEATLLGRHQHPREAHPLPLEVREIVKADGVASAECLISDAGHTGWPSSTLSRTRSPTSMIAPFVLRYASACRRCTSTPAATRWACRDRFPASALSPEAVCSSRSRSLRSASDTHSSSAVTRGLPEVMSLWDGDSDGVRMSAVVWG
jgi:hypothetical protein